MWPDNETDIDLLGFDFLVDSLVIVLSEPRLLPLTVGVLGDWGSGKSSLMSVACAELTAAVEDADDPEGRPRRYVCVQFSPWRYEDYEDVKVSLMSAVLSRLAVEVPEHREEVGRIRAMARRLRRTGRRAARGGIELFPQSIPAIAAMVDPSLADPEMLKIAQQGAQMAAAAASQRLADPQPAPTAAEEPVTEVDAFRDRFAALIDSLDEVAAVVVFIDDLDRCLPETVVDTFEAIRLLLGAPRTAFVLAAHQEVVASAVDARYPALRRDDRVGGIGAQYLEKMFQQKITVPALAIPEAVTYVSLLLAELHLDADDFRAVREHVAAQRATHAFEVVFGLGTLGDLGIDVPAALVTDLTWAAAIAPVLAAGSRRNPRQLKQFLNALQLRRRSAARRRVELDPAVLAKLMLLEDQQFSEFQQLFDWQIDSGGPSCPQLAAAEELMRSLNAPETDEGPPATEGADKPEPPSRARKPRRTAVALPVDEAVQQWAAKPAVRAWLDLPPRLAAKDLRPYFTYSRDRLSLASVSISRLSARQQQMLTQILGTTDRLRRKALDDLKAADPADQDVISGALGRALLTTPDDAFVAVCEAVERVETSRDVLFAALDRLPIAAVPAKYVPTAGAHLPRADPRTEALLTKWHGADRPDLTKMVTLVRRTSARH